MVKFESNVEKRTFTTDVANIGDTLIKFKDTTCPTGKSFSLIIQEKIDYLTNYRYDMHGMGDKLLSSSVIKKLAVFITNLHDLTEQEQIDVLNNNNGDK